MNKFIIRVDIFDFALAIDPDSFIHLYFECHLNAGETIFKRRKRDGALSVAIVWNSNPLVGCFSTLEIKMKQSILSRK